MKNEEHKVLALKYRPKNFNELIGQDIMVETITNSIKLNKIPNAYLFTGIRGVGKTTTARIVAKSLNCTNGITKLCSDKMCDHCMGITNSNHLDVLEMDAASRTGIDDIREIIESSKYNPTSAKYKIIILDEVHMLSKQAFNGLLKTLEEPPPHLKFIFATTEVKKIPVTIISRCQRFDLHRVPLKDLIVNLKQILKKEGGKITDQAITLIAKAAEGSVRDSLSLLDRALVSQDIENKEIGEIFIRKMLGIADRSKILDLLSFIFEGEQKKSIYLLREMVDEGIQPNSFLNDVLEIIHLIQQNKSLGDLENELSISEAEKDMICSISKSTNMTTLIVFWQFIIKTMEELSAVSNPILSLEMLIVRLVHLKSAPSYDNLLSELKKNNYEFQNDSITTQANETQTANNDDSLAKKTSKDQIKNTIQIKPVMSNADNFLKDNKKKEKVLSFEDLIHLASDKKEIQLKYDLEKNVNLIKFSQGKIDISFNQNLDKNFVRNLSTKLVEWTGNRWVITLSKEVGKKTFLETKIENEKQAMEKEKKGEAYTKFKNFFPDAELIEIKEED